MVQTLREGAGKDLPSPADAVVEAVGAGMDDGYGQLLMWRVHPRGLVTVPDEEFGHMQSSHRCVCVCVCVYVFLSVSMFRRLCYPWCLVDIGS